MGLSNAERQARWRARQRAKVAELERQAQGKQTKQRGATAAHDARRIRELEAKVAELESKGAKLKKTIRELRDRLTAAQRKAERSGSKWGAVGVVMSKALWAEIEKALHSDLHPGADAARKDLLKKLHQEWHALTDRKAIVVEKKPK
jgi:uncharacterized coiled-coil protein SlyX